MYKDRVEANLCLKFRGSGDTTLNSLILVLVFFWGFLFSHVHWGFPFGDNRCECGDDKVGSGETGDLPPVLSPG